MLLTLQDVVAAKADVCDLLKFGVACCLISISGDYFEVLDLY